LGHNLCVKRFGPVVGYTSARLVLFILTAIVLALLGMHGVGLLLVALLVSGLLSYVLLTRMRDAMSAAVVARTARTGRTDGTDGTDRDGGARPSGRLARMRTRLDERTRAEDEADDAARAVDDPPV
jgi:hypothetical protein